MFTEYSLWFLPLLLIVAFAGSFFSYGRHRFGLKNDADSVSTFAPKQKYILFALRFLGIFLILFLFLSPVKQIKNKTIEKPTVVLLQDNSSSLSAVKESDYYKTEYVNRLDNLSKNLAKDYNVVRLLTGSSTIQLQDNIKFKDTLKFNDFATDISQSLEFVTEEFSSENLSAVILATDGIVTQGNNFLNYADKLTCPVYTVAMGDTTVRKDVFISDVQYNKIAFIDSDYPMEVTVRADMASGEKSALFMVKDGKTTQIKSFTIDDNDYSVTAEIKASSKKPGVEKISFYVGEINGEDNKINNRKDIFNEVLDSKKKVLIAASAPHPDISALKSALSSNGNYQIDVNVSNESLKNSDNYDLIVLHSLPDNSVSYNTIKSLQEKGKSLMFIIGQSTDVKLFNALNTGIRIQVSGNGLNNVSASYNSNFSLFTVTDDITNILKDLPPLTSIAARYQTNENIRTLLFQKIGAVTTTYPLIAYNNETNSKKAFIVCENIWKWRLQNYLINESADQIDEIFTKTAQLVSSKSDKNRFCIEHRDIYGQNENVIFSAQFYNDNFELINTPEVSLRITGQSIDNSYTFGKNNNAYYLNLGTMREGEYSFTAKTDFNKKEYTQKGRFIQQIMRNCLLWLLNIRCFIPYLQKPMPEPSKQKTYRILKN